MIADHLINGADEARSPTQSGTLRRFRPSASPPSHFRVRTDRVDPHGTVTLRYFNRLLHSGVGRAYKAQVVRLFVADLEVRIVRDDGLLIRDFVLDPSRNYQGLEQGP